LINIINILKNRSKLVLLRSHGLINNHNQLIQHLNPICRVSRIFPVLPISRLLMSLNDYDMPNRPADNLYIIKLFQKIISCVLYLPFNFIETVIYIILTVFINLLAYGLYQLYNNTQTLIYSFIPLIIIIIVTIIFGLKYKMPGFKSRH
jgi:hypothetical protein